MKFLLTSLFIISPLIANAGSLMCPTGDKEILKCTAKAFVPMYPFVSVCEKNNGDTGIALSSGAGRSIEVMQASRDDQGDVTTYQATEADTDNLKFSFNKSADPKINGTLTYTVFSVDFESKYKCVEL